MGRQGGEARWGGKVGRGGGGTQCKLLLLMN